jgi:hypothetical protein
MVMKNIFLILALVALTVSCSPAVTEVAVPTVDTTLVSVDTTKVSTNSVVTTSVCCPEVTTTSVVTSTK